jgi:hypothetical protein
MSDVNLNFVVNTYDATFTVENVDLTLTPNAVELGIYTGGYATAAGSSGQVQYNNGGILAGNSQMTFSPSTGLLNVTQANTSNLTTTNLTATTSNTSTLNVATLANLGSVANVKMLGGSSGQIVTTDGTGNLSFSPAVAAGANTQLQYNNNGYLTGLANVTFSGGNLRLGAIPNVKITGGTNGQVIKTDGAGNLYFGPSGGTPGGSNTQIQYNNNGNLSGVGVLTFNGSNLSITSNSVLKIGGGSSGQMLGTDGSGNLSWLTPPGGGNTAAGGSPTQLQYNNSGVLGGMANITFDNSSNVLTMGGNVDLTGTPKLHQGRESVYAVSPSTSVNIDILTNGAITWFTGIVGADFTLNLRGNSSTTFLSQINNYETATIVVVTNVGSTVHYNTAFSIDGTSQTVKWVNGLAPSAATIDPNSYVAYTYTITRTTFNSYVVLGSFTGYQ